jgi:hypothetical protein
MARVIRLMGVALLTAAHALAQTCADNKPEQAAALIERVHLSCEKGEYPTTTDIYDLAGVAGEAGIKLTLHASWRKKQLLATGASRERRHPLFLIRTARNSTAIGCGVEGESLSKIE